MNYKYENLALEGGGVWGIAYGGALEELDQLGVLSQIKRVAGTSAGSITALQLALGYSGAEIKQTFSELDFSRFLDNRHIRTVFQKYGLYESQYALDLFQGWVENKLGSKQATFQDLHEAGKMELKVYATNLNTRHIHEFSYEKSKDVPLAMAVRASMSVPLFFTAVKVNDHLFVDGGTIYDYPLLSFGKESITSTLGLAFSGSSSVAGGTEGNMEFDYDNPMEYVRRLVTVLERAQAPLLALYATLRENTILIDTGDVSSLDFKVSEKTKNFLMENGRKAVRAHFQQEGAEN
jgi:NTE family protein